MGGGRTWRFDCIYILYIVLSRQILIGHSFLSPLDCEQSLFFFRFSKGSARARQRLKE